VFLHGRSLDCCRGLSLVFFLSPSCTSTRTVLRCMLSNRRDSICEPGRIRYAVFLLHGLANGGKIIEPLHLHPRARNCGAGAHSPCLCTEFSVSQLRQILGGFIILLSFPGMHSQWP
jgi:hypothetical protein